MRGFGLAPGGRPRRRRGGSTGRFSIMKHWQFANLKAFPNICNSGLSPLITEGRFQEAMGTLSVFFVGDPLKVCLIFVTLLLSNLCSSLPSQPLVPARYVPVRNMRGTVRIFELRFISTMDKIRVSAVRVRMWIV